MVEIKEKLAAEAEDDIVKRERQQTAKYRKLYTDLLLKYRGVIDDARKREHSDEAQKIQRMIESERNALFFGFCVGVTFFATLRVLPKFLIRRLGGEEKIQTLRKADEEAKQMGIYAYQQVFRLVVEGSFSVWVATRAYQYQSRNSNGAYETFAQLPLSSGRSIVSEAICDEWINITTQKIPKAFWKNLVIKDGLRDERSWRAILAFSVNCQKRARLEKKLKVAKGSAEEEKQPPITMLSKDHDEDISFAEAKRLVEDNPGNK